MERLRIIYNTLTLLYKEGDLTKEAYLRRKKEMINELTTFRDQSKKRILNLDSFILILENENAI